MTREQIAKALEKQGKTDIAAHVRVVSLSRSMNEMEKRYQDGLIDANELDAYCYVWENLTPRLSDEFLYYELHQTTEEDKQLRRTNNGIHSRDLSRQRRL